MQKVTLSALMIALISGVAIGAQATLNSAAGKITGAILTGLLVNFLGGIAAGLILAALFLQQGRATWTIVQAPTVGLLLISGLLGIAIIAGIAYSLPKIGIAAGLSAVIAGQMVVAVVVDTLGLAGAQAIPLDWARIGGLGLLAVGTWLLLPKG